VSGAFGYIGKIVVGALSVNWPTKTLIYFANVDSVSYVILGVAIGFASIAFESRMPDKVAHDVRTIEAVASKANLSETESKEIWRIWLQQYITAAGPSIQSMERK